MMNGDTSVEARRGLAPQERPFMKRVFFNEFNILMGNTTYWPMAFGLLQAFAETRETITQHDDFRPYLFPVDRPESIPAEYENPAVAE